MLYEILNNEILSSAISNGKIGIPAFNAITKVVPSVVLIAI